MSALAAIGLVLLLQTGCGDDDLPDGAAAVVAGDVISERELTTAQRALSSTPGAPATSSRRALKAIIAQRWIQRRAREEGVSSGRGSEGEAAGASTAGARFEGNALVTAALRRKLILRQAHETGALSDEAIRRYRKRHEHESTFPERRDMWLLAYPTQRAAKAAKVAIQTGATWEQLWRTSLHEVLGGGRPLFALLPTEAPPSLDRAVFGSKPGQLVGPVRTPAAWYILEVDRVTPGAESTPSLQSPAIKATIMRQLARRLAASMRESYRAETICRPTLRLSECRP